MAASHCLPFDIPFVFLPSEQHRPTYFSEHITNLFHKLFTTDQYLEVMLRKTHLRILSFFLFFSDRRVLCPRHHTSAQEPFTRYPKVHFPQICHNFCRDPVLVSHPKQVQHFPNQGFCFYCERVAQMGQNPFLLTRKSQRDDENLPLMFEFHLKR